MLPFGDGLGFSVISSVPLSGSVGHSGAGPELVTSAGASPVEPDS